MAVVMLSPVLTGSIDTLLSSHCCELHTLHPVYDFKDESARLADS